MIYMKKKKLIKVEFKNKLIDSAIFALCRAMSNQSLKIATNYSKKGDIKEFMHYYVQARIGLLGKITEKLTKFSCKSIEEDFEFMQDASLKDLK